MKIAPKIALVTGACSGIGLAVSRVLKEAGYYLILLDCEAAGLKPALQSLRLKEGDADFLLTDLNDPSRILAAFQKISEKFGRLDILVNSAGLVFVDDITLPHRQDMDDLLNVNLLAVMVAIQQAVPLMRKAGGGRVVNIASTAGVKPMKNQALYTAAKAGVIALGRALREEYRESGIRFTTISPGPTKTNILRNLPEAFIKKHKIMEEPRIEAIDVARIVSMLLSLPANASLDEVVLTPAAWEWA